MMQAIKIVTCGTGPTPSNRGLMLLNSLILIDILSRF
jgi:hypothetical protein